MHKDTTQQNMEEKELQSVLDEISVQPDTHAVASSFSSVMETVTNPEFDRIPYATEKDVSPLHPVSIMKNITKIFAVAVPALALVLMVGYVTFQKDDMSNYDDIFTVALSDESMFEEESFEDDYEDLLEDVVSEDVSDLLAYNEVPKPTPQKQTEIPTTEPVTKDLETTLTALDALFDSDDIDDAALDTWFADESASDTLFETYDI